MLEGASLVLHDNSILAAFNLLYVVSGLHLGSG
jgi:hypothetical protein